MALEINTGLDQLGIYTTGVHAKSRWTGFIVHGVPSHIGTTNTSQLAETITREIKAAQASPSPKPQDGSLDQKS